MPKLIMFLAALVAIASLAAPSFILKPAYSSGDGVVAQSVSTTSPGGNYLKKIKVGTQFTVSVSIANTGSAIHDYTAVMEVRDAGGFTVWLDTVTGLMGPGQQVNVGPTVLLDKVGEYSVRAFTYSSPALRQDRSVSISPVVSAPISAVEVNSIHQAGVYIPLYEYPELENPGSVWSTLIKVKGEHPTVPFAATINPSSGPGFWQDPNYAAGTSALRSAGIEYVLGYIHTDYARQTAGATLSDIKGSIDRYRAWYPDINGIMLDEMNSGSGQVGFYKEIASYARSQGIEFIIANPGTRADREYIGLFDNIMIYEQVMLPSVSQLQENTYFPEYPAENFSFAIRNISYLDPAYVAEAIEQVGFLYITNDVESPADTNPYNTLPPYFGDLVAMLELPK
jgi:hypothetical protein